MPNINTDSFVEDNNAENHWDNNSDNATVHPENVTNTPHATQTIFGLSAEELNDYQKISITIADKQAPIVVLFGPPACGKTMTLIRLARYLKAKDYTVTPIRSFRPSYDTNYNEICEKFDSMVNQDDAAKSTDKISFMLVRVTKNGRTICQILEAPGELYFDPKFPKAEFPRYLNAITNCDCRKIWTVLVEPDWLNESDRRNYVQKIKDLKKKMGNRDRTIIVYNKIDRTDFLINNSGEAYIGPAKKNVMDLYEGIFEPFRNDIPISRWFTPYRFDFSIFQTGDYSKTADGTMMFEQGPDVFPRNLWNIILKRVRG